MKIKHSKKILAGIIAATLILGAGMSGCSLVSTNNAADLNQVVAEVDISKKMDKLKEEGLDGYAGALKRADVKNITKRDLMSAYINYGSSYQDTNMSMGDIMSNLIDMLTNNSVLTQYSTVYMLKVRAEEEGLTAAQVVEKFNDSSLTEAERYEYLLGGADSDRVLEAKYSFYSFLNNSIDSYEKEILDEKEETSGTETRDVPTGIDGVNDEYNYPKTDDGKLNYGVYTGYENYLYNEEWDYEILEGSTRSTRQDAYSEFLSRLKRNYMVTDADKDLTDILSLTYIQEEYVMYLTQEVVNSYYDAYSKEQEELMSSVDASGKYTFIQKKYDEDLISDAASYGKVSDFGTAVDGMSDSSFVLYSPDTASTTKDGQGAFGLVYNILLPFDGYLSRSLKSISEERTKKLIDDAEFFIKRNELLKQIKTTDQRSAYFKGATDYSYNAEEKQVESYYGKEDGRKYLFFENNTLNAGEGKKYSELDKYIGKYSYNGTVTKNKDDSYELKPNQLTIDDMLDEFKGYLDYVLGAGSTTYTPNEAYYTTAAEDYYKLDNNDKKVVDYSKLVYGTGKVDVGEWNIGDLMNRGTKQYKALSAVNELQYAYTTDTGILSKYAGYSVSPFDTTYIAEFRYAAQEAIKGGAGTFSVCAGDYGWHLIYVTATYNAAGGEVYQPNFTADRINEKGTFENLYYEWIKSKILSDVSTTQKTLITGTYSGSSITKYESTYKDLV